MIKNKKAFTLIEVIGVVTILALMLLLAVPAMTKTLKRNEQKKYDHYIDNLKLATESYVVDRLKEGVTIGDVYYITLGDLIDEEFVQETIKNPENGGTLSRNTQIAVIKNLDGTRDYKVKEHYLLPSDYTLVEYIESTGTQYIDTGIVPTNDTGVEIVYYPTNVTASQYILGSRDGATGNIAYALNGASSRTDWDIRHDGQTTFSNVNRTNNKFNSKMILKNGRVDWSITNLDTNSSVNIVASNKTVTAQKNLMLFAYNNVNIHKGLRVYSCNIYDEELVVREFVPCYRNSDNEVGLFDLVNLKFYTNKGTGEFTYGEK